METCFIVSLLILLVAFLEKIKISRKLPQRVTYDHNRFIVV